MTAAIPAVGRSIGQIVCAGIRPPTGNPVWANSYDVDDERCANYTHDVDRDELGPMLTEVARLARETKAAGKRCGALRTWGVELMRYLYGEARRNKGFCAPSREQIAKALGISRSCVEDTLRALRDAGLLEWIRRTVVGDGEGPARKQTSNLYRFLMPKALAWRVSKYLVRKFGRRPGTPRSLTATLTPEQIDARRVQSDCERLMRALRRAARPGRSIPPPGPDERQV